MLIHVQCIILSFVNCTFGSPVSYNCFLLIFHSKLGAYPDNREGMLLAQCHEMRIACACIAVLFCIQGREGNMYMYIQLMYFPTNFSNWKFHKLLIKTCKPLKILINFSNIFLTNVFFYQKILGLSHATFISLIFSFIGFLYLFT